MGDARLLWTSVERQASFPVLWRLAAIAMLALWITPRASAQVWGNPVWNDEFNATVPGTPPDPSIRTFDVGSEGWGNSELETYCGAGSSVPVPCDAAHPNAFQDGQGHLIIQALRTSSEPAPAGTWTSARLKTLGLKDFQYGRLESCMRLPVGAGLWPAFWMMGSKGKWPLGGEMDIMENVPATGGSGGGLGPTMIESTIHGPSASPKGLYSLGADFTFLNGKRIDDETPSCHVYGAVWSPFMVQFYVDDWRKPFFVRTAGDVPPGDHWIFNTPFYFLLNLAVGGTWPGPPNNSTVNPAQMVVDYVRVYKANHQDSPAMSAAAIKLKNGTVVSTTVHLSATPGTGFVYVTCSVAAANATCSIDTGNSLNASVVDLSELGTQTVKLAVTLAAGSGTTSPPGPVTVTAYTVGGGQSTLTIPIERN